MSTTKKQKLADRNIGVCWERTKYKNLCSDQENLEAIFQKEWNTENTPKPGINRGLGSAQELFCVSSKSAETFSGPKRDDKEYFGRSFEKEVMVYDLTVREHKIIATVIQWLGTNCGFAFLQRCFQMGGYTIVRTNKPKLPITPILPLISRRFLRIFKQKV